MPLFGNARLPLTGGTRRGNADEDDEDLNIDEPSLLCSRPRGLSLGSMLQSHQSSSKLVSPQTSHSAAVLSNSQPVQTSQRNGRLFDFNPPSTSLSLSQNARKADHAREVARNHSSMNEEDFHSSQPSAIRVEENWQCHSPFQSPDSCTYKDLGSVGTVKARKVDAAGALVGVTATRHSSHRRKIETSSEPAIEEESLSGEVYTASVLTNSERWKFVDDRDDSRESRTDQVRSIPGPAGVCDTLMTQETVTQCTSSPATTTTLELPLRRKRGSIDPDDPDFSSPTWLKMLKDLDIPPFKATSPGATTITCSHPLVQATIAQVLKDGYLKKIPKLFAFVKSINLLDDCADAVQIVNLKEISALVT
eukprot:755843-Hanusia_phi.AAC.3